jgi:hypothetical protein
VAYTLSAAHADELELHQTVPEAYGACTPVPASLTVDEAEAKLFFGSKTGNKIVKRITRVTRKLPIPEYIQLLRTRNHYSLMLSS